MPTNEPNPHAADLFAAIKTPEDMSAVLRQTMHRTMYMAAKLADESAALQISDIATSDVALKEFADSLRKAADRTWGSA